MVCCVLGLLTLLAGASTRGLRTLLGAWPVAILAGGAVTALAVLLPHHLNHYRQRALDHDRSVMAEVLAAPLCTGVAFDQPPRLDQAGLQNRSSPRG